jgi:hypothetical protein
MKNLLPVVAVLALALAVGASAGTRAKDKSTATPTVAGDGVPLADSVGCRMSARVDGGGNLDQGSLIPYYRDTPIAEWTPAASSLWCTVAPLPDGGLRSSFVCPDMEPLARFGLVSVGQFGLKGRDGGSGAAALADAGPSSQPILRIECWGPSIP